MFKEMLYNITRSLTLLFIFESFAVEMQLFPKILIQ